MASTVRVAPATGTTPSLFTLKIRHYSMRADSALLSHRQLTRRCSKWKLTLARFTFASSIHSAVQGGQIGQGFTGPLRPWMADTSLHGCIHGESRKPLPDLAPAECSTNYMSRNPMPPSQRNLQRLRISRLATGCARHLLHHVQLPRHLVPGNMFTRFFLHRCQRDRRTAAS